MATKEKIAERISENKSRFLTAYRATGTVWMAADAIGITRNCFVKWKQADTEFAADADAVKQYIRDKVFSTLYTKCSNGDTTACIFLLKGLDHDFRDSMRHEAGDTPVEHVVRVVYESGS